MFHIIIHMWTYLYIQKRRILYNQMKNKKYIEIYKKIKNQILYGEFMPGEKLPSKRVTADKNGCSVITVQTAYNMLQDEGYIVSKERSGYFVCHIDAIKNQGKTERKTSLNYLTDEILPDNEFDFEYSVWFKTIRKVITEKNDILFKKSPNKGCAILRNAIADYLYRYRGMIAQPKQIIIGSGSEQLYEMVVKILGRDKMFGIEDPSYSQIEAVYQGNGVNIKKLKLGKDGIDSKILHNNPIDVLHVTPFRSYPTGFTTSITKRNQYLNWASTSRYIVEDDFNSEFFLPGQPIETLYNLDQNQRVIYINTFSKSLSPSMRLGYMILPEALLCIYDEKLSMFSCSVPVIDQYVLAEFINSGNFERHLNRCRRKMK